jgi:putative sterol carrier protein
LTTARVKDSTAAPRSEEANPMAVDIKKLFNEELPAALGRNAEDAKTIGARYQISITGPTGGDWNVDVSSTGPSCKPGSGPADCTIVVSDEDFQKLIENPWANGMTLFFAGKLKLTGNPMLATKLQKLFSYK